MKRILLLTAGFIFLGLGALGALLPVLPTTPFLLLAAGCFAQSSERWHQCLLNNKYAGPMIKDWEENRCVSWKTKFVALTSMAVVGGMSVTLALDVMLNRVVALGLMGLGAMTVLSLPTCPAKSDASATTEAS